MPPVVKKDPGPPDWQQIWLEDQEAERAAIAIERRGGFDQVLRQASPEQLMILVSIAQAVGEPQHAMAALRRVVESYPRDPAAPQAAFMLGTALEKAGDRAGAERAFATCRALSPQSEIAEDALARQIEAALEQGERAGARQLVDQYEREFPQGSRLAEFRAALAKNTGESSAAAAPSVTTAEPEVSPNERQPAPAASAGR
jgi:outer membrane protein assembly factor BamD (BamD/ComL family)